MARPEGYRKAVRLMEMADRFDIPVLCSGRHRGRLSRHRRGGARPGRGDRALDRSLSQSRRAERRGHPRRRRLGRRGRDRHRQPRADARARDLQRDLAGGRGLDPVARHHQGAGRRHQHEDHSGRSHRIRHHRRHRHRADRRRPPRSGRRDCSRPARWWRKRSPNSRDSTARPCGGSAATSSSPSAETSNRAATPWGPGYRAPGK